MSAVARFWLLGVFAIVLGWIGCEMIYRVSPTLMWGVMIVLTANNISQRASYPVSPSGRSTRQERP